MKSCPWRETQVGQVLVESLNLDPNATKAEVEELLQRKAASLTLPIYAQSMIAAPWSYEYRFAIPSAAVTTNRQRIQFNEPVLLVGWAFEITSTEYSTPGPALKEIDCRIDSRLEREFWTARNDSKSSAGPNGFVPLSVLDYRSPRYFMRILESTDADVGVELKPRYAAGFNLDILVSVIALALPLNWV